MSFLFDIGLIVLVGMFAYTGYRKGLIISLVNVAGTLIACAVSPLLSSTLSMYIYNSFIESEITESVGKAIEGMPLNYTAMEKANEVFENVSNSLHNMLSLVGVTPENLATEISATEVSAVEMDIPQLIEGMVRPIAVRLVSTILTIVIFIILTIVLKYAAHIATKTLEVVKLGVVNRLLGGIFGIGESIFIIMMLSLIIYFVTMFMSPEACSYMNEKINGTIIYRLVYEYSIPDAIIALFLPQ